ncbi:succinyl-diaminopimelate desuccinylase [Helicobacter sp. 13S00477-4]|uniref:succinyl-diaminopimelate desuccinylase n=1 Tax=Helicobacter sp. 13S00477-4 TaxID=1905759 RepID=UPI000BA54263|nr:succinyl-diaminopimelate desuccinylase [Helicobacter sp. 13S00477-4]PAF52707.1 succinyl-diaminopimelate desuccinylase [Helicobacter sp. 13S00477-4]
MTPLEVLSKLISYPTITPRDCGIFDFIQSLLPDFESIYIEKEGVKNIFLYKCFGNVDKNSLHFCFAGHIDVVPPGEGWNSEPFVAHIRENYLYGRGAQDMKGGVSAFLCAMRDFIQNDNFKFPLILSILLTSDEEGPGIYGTKIVLEALKERGLLPQMVLVAEPTCDKIFGDTIKIGRRGSINGIINIKGIQGHVAYPQKCSNPIELLGKKLGDIAGINLDEGDEYFAPSKLVVTDIRGGIEAVNVTPANLKIMFNVRNSTKTDIEDIQDYIKKILKGLDYDLKLTQSSHPFITNSSFLLHLLKNAIQKICSVIPDLSTSGGTSDAKYFGAFGIEVVDFGVCNDRIHSVDERVCLDDINSLYQIFLELLKSLIKENNET